MHARSPVPLALQCLVWFALSRRTVCGATCGFWSLILELLVYQCKQGLLMLACLLGMISLCSYTVDIHTAHVGPHRAISHCHVP